MRYEVTPYDHTCPGCQGCGAIACGVCAGIGNADDAGPRPPAEDAASGQAARTAARHACPVCHGAGAVSCDLCHGKGTSGSLPASRYAGRGSLP